MGLVEAITGEVLPVVEHRRRCLSAHAFLHRPLDEFLAVHLERPGLFLGYGLAQSVRFCRSVAGHLHGGEHDLLLIDGNSIGLLKDRGQRRVPIGDLLVAMHAADIRGDEIHGARAVECHHSDDVGQLARLHLHQIAAHAGAFHLEDTQDVPSSQKGIGFRVIDGDGLDIHFDPMSLPDHLAGASHDRQGGEAQKIDLQQTQRVQDLHLKLGHRPDRAFLVVPTGGSMQGDIFHDGLIRDDHASGMGTGVTDHAL